MTQTTIKRTPATFAAAFWMAINIFLMITLIAKRRRTRLKQLHRNRTLGNLNSRIAVDEKMGRSLRHIHPNLHLKHKHGHLNLLSSLDKRPASNNQRGNHNLPVQDAL